MSKLRDPMVWLLGLIVLLMLGSVVAVLVLSSMYDVSGGYIPDAGHREPPPRDAGDVR